MKHVSIEDFVERVQTWSPQTEGGNSSIRYIDISAVSQTEKAITEAQTIEAAEAPSRARQKVRAGDILVSTVRPNLNAVAVVPDDLDGATASTGFTVLRPDERNLSGNFLFHWVRSPAFITEMMRLATGQSYPAVSDKIVKASKIPLPPLKEQRRIAGILDQADALRRLRTHALHKLNTLGQAIFHEMFGDVRVENLPLKKLGKVSTGSTPSTKISEYFDGEVPFITPGDLENDHPVVRYLSELGAEKSRTVQAGATLVCCIGATIGKMGVTRQLSAFNQQINAVEWGREIVPDYGYFAMQAIRGEIQHRGKGASTTLPILKKSSFEQLTIPVAPLADQRAFSARYQQALSQRIAFKQGMRAAESLFASLQHSAFKGEL